MNWLLPGFLGAALAVALPVALHFLRSKPKVMIRFPTLRFLAPSAIEDTTKHRLMRLIALALRCLIIGLLAAGFARPFFANERAGGGRVMIAAVDNSMGMQAGRRWEEQRAWALEQLKELEPGDKAGILLMQPAPAWLAPISEDVDAARAALGAMEPGFETAHYMPALRVAGETLGNFPAREKTIVWMSDEQRLGWIGAQFGETLPPGVKVRFGETAPMPKSQAAITGLRWAHVGLDPAVEVKTRLYAPEAQTRQATVKTQGKVVAEEALNLTAGPEQTVVIPLKGAPEALKQGLSVSLDPDDLAADDTEWLAPRGEAARTVLYSPGPGPESHFLDHALGSLAVFDADGIVGKPYPEGEWPAGAVAIATGDCFRPPLQERLNNFVAAGGALWIVVDGSEGQTAWLAARGVRVTPELTGAEGEEPGHLRDWDLDHPILGAFAGQSVLPLMDVEFVRSYGLAGESLTPVANWPDGSAGLAEMTAASGRIFIDGFPLDRTATNWPVQPSFVPFVHQTLRWLAALQERKSDWRIGDVIPLQGRAGLWRELEGARPRADEKVSGSVRPAAPGLYEFSDGNGREVFAVNPAAAESDLTPWPDHDELTAFESKAGPEREEAAAYEAAKLSDEAAESRQRLWWWLLALVGAALLAELAVANRTAM